MIQIADLYAYPIARGRYDPVLTADDLAGRPGEFDRALARARILRLFYTLRESDGPSNPDAQFVDRLLVVFVLGRRLS